MQAILIITNHFKQLPVNTKIVYANKHFLKLLDCDLSDILDSEPVKFLKDWNKDKFITEIVQCVEQGINWRGDLHLIDKNNKIIKKSFTITPVYGLNGDINFYSCSTAVDEISKAETNGLDEYIDSINQFYQNFQHICEQSPVNLVKINTKGNIDYCNSQCQKNFGFQTGQNFFKMIENNTSVKRLFANKKIIGKVNKAKFDIISNGMSIMIECKFWPIIDDDNSITGFSIAISDKTRDKEFANEILALKGR